MFELFIKDYSKTWSLHRPEVLAHEVQVPVVAVLLVESHQGNVIQICLN